MKLFFTALIFFLLTSFQEPSLKWDYDKREWSPLMLSIYNGETDKFSKLIKRSKNVTYVAYSKSSGWELTALDIALFMNNDLAVSKLLKTKKFKKLDMYLFKAASYGNDKIIDLLLDYGANGNYLYEKSNFTPLMMAVNNGSIDVLTTLLKRVPECINKKNKNGTTALMFACKRLEIEKVKVLLEYKADVNLKDIIGKTAVDYLSKDYTFSEKANKAELFTKIKGMLGNVSN